MINKFKKNLIFFTITIFLLSTFLFSMPSLLYAYPAGQCTAYAKQMRSDDIPNDLGDAKDWAINAAASDPEHGFPVDNIPMAGDIAVFQPRDHGCNPVNGHVAYVEKANSDGSFDISESNVKNGGTSEKPRHIDSVWPDDRFIHQKPDLVVSDIKFYKPGTTEEFTPRAGQKVTAYAVLENNGFYKTVPFNVKWFLDGKEVGSGSNSSLAINTCATNNVYYNWQATEGTHTIKFEADYYCVVYESKEDNNIFQKEFNVPEATFIEKLLDGFGKVIDFLADVFIPGYIRAAEPSTTQSANIAASQESKQGIQGSVTTETTAPISPPTKPSLVSPYNWYQSIGESPTLRWQGDSNSVSYYVLVNSSNTGNVVSGWIITKSWKPNLPNQNYVYTWKVKAKNSQGVEGPWSDESHFSITSTTLQFEGDISFSPPSPSSADQIKIFASTTGWGGVGVTLRVSVNTSPDGSSNGEWKILKELGVPKFNENDAPLWDTKGWSNGTYRIRVEAKGPDDPNWQNPAVIETTYELINKILQDTTQEVNLESDLADLVVTDIKFYRPQTTEEVTPQAGQTVTAFAVLKNLGGESTPVFNIKWYLDGVEVGYGSHASLPPSSTSSGNIRYDWQVTAGNHTLSFVADCDGHVDESNEGNNSHQESVSVETSSPEDLADLVVNGDFSSGNLDGWWITGSGDYTVDIYNDGGNNVVRHTTPSGPNYASIRYNVSPVSTNNLSFSCKIKPLSHSSSLGLWVCVYLYSGGSSGLGISPTGTIVGECLVSGYTTPILPENSWTSVSANLSGYPAYDTLIIQAVLNGNSGDVVYFDDFKINY